jgi:hypothetical protein
MRRRPLRALSLAAALVAAMAAAAPPEPRPRDLGARFAAPVTVSAAPLALDLSAPGVRVVGALAVRGDHRWFGGLSGLAIGADGEDFVAVGDRGALIAGRILRAGGALAGLADVTISPLRDPDGVARGFGDDDAEGLARAPDGALLISFEGDAPRIWRYAAGDAAARPVALPPALRRLQRNSGLEALAAGPDGAIYAIPEPSGDLALPFPFWRRAPDGAGWEAGAWPRTPPFLVTGADVGPDGRLYVVERSFTWLGGFSWRLLRADLADWPDLRPDALLTVRGGVDNVESVSLWRDAGGSLRAALLTDDNFSPLQRTVLIELALD